jgi:hypothetical protein
MTNFEPNGKAATIIEEVLEEINDEYLYRRIDEPIERSAASFEFDRDAPVTHQTFIQVITGFVRHVYEQAHGCWQEMSAKEAYAEAVAILEEGYQTAAITPRFWMHPIQALTALNTSYLR